MSPRPTSKDRGYADSKQQPPATTGPSESMAPTSETPFGHFNRHSNKILSTSDSHVASKPKTKAAVIRDTFRRFGASISQVAQSSKMFTTSHYLLGFKSKATRQAEAVQAEEMRAAEAIRVEEIRPEALRADASRAEAIRKKVDHFRVLVIGRANAGKTTILQKVCNTSDKPEIFDSKGNKVRLHCANDRHNADVPVIIRSTHHWLRPPLGYKIKSHYWCYADVLSARIAQHRKRAGVSE